VKTVTFLCKPFLPHYCLSAYYKVHGSFSAQGTVVFVNLSAVAPGECYTRPRNTSMIITKEEVLATLLGSIKIISRSENYSPAINTSNVNLMSVCPCIVVDIKRVKPTRCYTMVYWTLWFAEHVSGIIMSIIRSLRLYRWPQHDRATPLYPDA
jgi:hypothetical protein